MFSKGDWTNWSHKISETTEIIIDITPSYRIDNLPKRFNESLLKKTEMTMKESDNVRKKLNNT